jgi:hypothetical protein
LASRVPTTKEWRCNASTGFSLSKFMLFYKITISHYYPGSGRVLVSRLPYLPTPYQRQVERAAAGFHAEHLCTISFNGLFSVADFLDFHSAELWYFWTSVWLFPPLLVLMWTCSMKKEL